jgi:CubicO group peptidase (beta-lactamase class C family)
MHSMHHAMRWFAAMLVLAIASPSTPADAQPPAIADPRAQLDPLANSLIADQFCSAVVVALIPADAPPRFLAWGETARGNGKLPDASTVFEIGSVSKVFTSLLLAQAVIDKQVALDTPVSALLPPGTKLPAGKRPITLLDLATHTSGLPRLPDNMHPADPANPYADYTMDQMYAFLAGAKLESEPGAKYAYSNLGAGLLGQALARRGKADWVTLVATQITRPLAMASTMVALTDDARARFAQGYSADGDPAKPWDFPTMAGAGGLRSTAADMVVFVKAELAAAAGHPTSRLARAMALSQTPQRTLDTGPAGGKIGLGWHMDAHGSISHNGQTGGFHSFVAFRPAQRLGVVVLTNGGALLIDKLGGAALAAVAGEPVPASLDLPPPDVAVDGKTLDGYAGTYEFAPGIAVEISHADGKLYAQVTGQPRFQLHPTAPREFALHVLPASVTFEVDAKGAPTGLVLHQNGDHRAKRK